MTTPENTETPQGNPNPFLYPELEALCRSYPTSHLIPLLVRNLYKVVAPSPVPGTYDEWKNWLATVGSTPVPPPVPPPVTPNRGGTYDLDNGIPPALEDETIDMEFTVRGALSGSCWRDWTAVYTATVPVDVIYAGSGAIELWVRDNFDPSVIEKEEEGDVHYEWDYSDGYSRDEIEYDRASAMETLQEMADDLPLHDMTDDLLN